MASLPGACGQLRYSQYIDLGPDAVIVDARNQEKREQITIFRR